MPEDKINAFLADVAALQLQFPVPTIAKRTYAAKEDVAAWIRGRKPAPHEFITRFYAAFKKELADKGIQRDVKQLLAHLPSPPDPVTEKDFLRSINAKLSAQNELTRDLLEQSKRNEQKLDELLRKKDKEIMKSAKDYLLGLVAALRSSVD